MDKIRKIVVFYQINNVLNTYNGLSNGSVHNLFINLPILMYRQ